MRLIDADALTRDACIKFYTTPHYKHILDLIDNAPTVDERPQGKWITTWERYIFQCSCCHGMSVKYNFCPNCGADMRGDEE